jgi:hypothetical protein
MWTIVWHRHPPHNNVEHTRAKILVSTLECQVSWRDTNDEVVDHDCNLSYTSKQGKWHYYACATKTINNVVWISRPMLFALELLIWKLPPLLVSPIVASFGNVPQMKKLHKVTNYISYTHSCGLPFGVMCCYKTTTILYFYQANMKFLDVYEIYLCYMRKSTLSVERVATCNSKW